METERRPRGLRMPPAERNRFLTFASGAYGRLTTRAHENWNGRAHRHVEARRQGLLDAREALEERLRILKVARDGACGSQSLTLSSCRFSHEELRPLCEARFGAQSGGRCSAPVLGLFGLCSLWATVCSDGAGWLGSGWPCAVFPCLGLVLFCGLWAAACPDGVFLAWLASVAFGRQSALMALVLGLFGRLRPFDGCVP